MGNSRVRLAHGLLYKDLSTSHHLNQLRAELKRPRLGDSSPQPTGAPGVNRLPHKELSDKERFQKNLLGQWLLHGEISGVDSTLPERGNPTPNI